MTTQYIDIKIDAKDSKRFRRRMQTRMRPVVQAILKDVSEKTYVPAIREEIIKEGLVFSGRLAAAPEVRPSIGFTAKVGIFDVHYASVVQSGRPHNPSRQEREKFKWWVRSKRNPDTQEELDIIVKAMIKKIKEEGTRPRPFMEEAITSQNARFSQLFNEQFRHEVLTKMAIQ